RPDRVEPGYGHVELAEELPEAGSARAYGVATFHEKPPAPEARRYMDEGCLWNTGIFVWRAESLVREVEEHAPGLAACLPLIDESDEAFFDAAPEGV
ncbi:MAG: hypothetical protein GWO22_09350, partial [Actinobacteria bacterium]|nr:hypothetical protein [Actinomycetota bacterium]